MRLLPALLVLASACAPDPQTDPAGSLRSRLEPKLDASCNRQETWSPDDDAWFLTCSLTDARADGAGVVLDASAARRFTYRRNSSAQGEPPPYPFRLAFRLSDGVWVCDDAYSSGTDRSSYSELRPSRAPCHDFARWCLCAGWPEGTRGF